MKLMEGKNEEGPFKQVEGNQSLNGEKENEKG